MKIQNITDVEKFFSVIDQCRGTVELVSPEGDRINLKSKLAQYLSCLLYTSVVSWSVRAMAESPASWARRTTCSGDRVPSDAFEWTCKST